MSEDICLMLIEAFQYKTLSPVSRFSYDIALLHLDSPAYANGFVEMGVLPAQGDILPDYYPCYVTGWGLVSGKKGGRKSFEGPSWFQRDHCVTKAARGRMYASFLSHWRSWTKVLLFLS